MKMSSLESARLEEEPLKKFNRHGAKNLNRQIVFTRWLLQTFPFLKDKDCQVVEIAGGKGELSARLCYCHHMKVTMVDPRPSEVAQCFLSVVLPRLPRKWKDSFRKNVETNPQLLNEIFSEKFSQLQMNFDEQTVETNRDLAEAIDKASLLIGMHADGATESVVNVALSHRKPFVVVPCCVFPNSFPWRTVEEDGCQVPVRSHSQFCKYLVNKHTNFVMEVLPFNGRNVAVWWDGVT